MQTRTPFKNNPYMQNVEPIKNPNIDITKGKIQTFKLASVNKMDVGQTMQYSKQQYDAYYIEENDILYIHTISP